MFIEGFEVGTAIVLALEWGHNPTSSHKCTLSVSLLYSDSCLFWLSCLDILVAQAHAVLVELVQV